MTQFKLHRVTEVILGILLLLAPLPQKYSYYQNLRVFVFLGGLYLIYHFRHKPMYKIAMIIMTVLFNPFLIISFGRDVWMMIDLSFAFLLGYLFWSDQR